MKNIRKLAVATIITMSFLSLTAPMPHAEACSGSNQSLMHFFSKGHSGGAHFTNYQIKQGTATATVEVAGRGKSSAIRFNGQMATASVSGAANLMHTHSTW